MKTLTAEEIANLKLKDDEAILVCVSGGTLGARSMEVLKEFIDACRKGDTPCGLVLEGAVSVTVIKTSEVTTRMVLIEENAEVGDDNQV